MNRVELKAELIQAVAKSRVAREAIRKSTGCTRAAAWREKRRVGIPVRYLLLAYAFVRGVEYVRVESVRTRTGPGLMYLAGLIGAPPLEVERWLYAAREPSLEMAQKAVA